MTRLIQHVSVLWEFQFFTWMFSCLAELELP
jgi:hypothetical protein